MVSKVFILLILTSLKFTDLANSKMRKNSPFTEEQQTFIILKYGEVGSISQVKRAFGTRFHPKHPRNAPSFCQIQRVVDRFLTTGSVNPSSPPGLPPTLEGDITRVKNYFDRNPRAHLRAAMVDLDMSIGKVWRILRKNLKYKPYRPHTAQILSPANKS